MSTKEIILSYMSAGVQAVLNEIPESSFHKVQEIRLRIGKPMLMCKDGAENRLDYLVTGDDINRAVEKMSDYSLYAFEEELRCGYITLPGGHRVGVAGRVHLESGSLRTIRNISALNIRVSHEVIGCCDAVIRKIAIPSPRHTMIISPPACGKTTLLRDIIRRLSDGFDGHHGVTVGIVDERSEIAGCYKGVPQNNVGMRTDVLDGCPKAEGMLILLRSMSPRVIAVDELGSSGDISAVDEIVNAGVCLICTVHGLDIADMMKKPGLDRLMSRRVFERFVVLKGRGKIDGIYDGEGMPL